MAVQGISIQLEAESMQSARGFFVILSMVGRNILPLTKITVLFR